MTLPIIDLSTTFSQCEDNWNSVAEDLVQALHTTGFIYLTGHGIDTDIVDKTFEATKSFFDLPLDKKMKNYRENIKEFIGYLELKEEKLPHMKNLEYKECYNIDLSAPVVPEEPAELGPAITEFSSACFDLQDRVYRLIATGLGVPNVDDFLQMIISDGHHNESNVKFVRYPKVPEGREIPDYMVRCAEHTDTIVMTFLFQDDVGGLEAKTTEGKWIPVTPIPGSVVVNVGEILEIWSNGYLKATPHRILMHKDDESLQRDRHSVIFFSTSHDDAPVVPLTTKVITSEEQKETSKVMKRFKKADKGNMTTLQYLQWRREINSDTV